MDLFLAAMQLNILKASRSWKVLAPPIFTSARQVVSQLPGWGRLRAGKAELRVGRAPGDTMAHGQPGSAVIGHQPQHPKAAISNYFSTLAPAVRLWGASPLDLLAPVCP